MLNNLRPINTIVLRKIAAMQKEIFPLMTFGYLSLSDTQILGRENSNSRIQRSRLSSKA